MSKVNHPSHYQSSTIEVIEIIRAFDLNFAVGNAIKYILRAGKKEGSPTVEDYKKAIWYLSNEIEAISGEKVRVDVIEKEESADPRIKYGENSKLSALELRAKFSDYFAHEWVVSESEHTGIKVGTVLEMKSVFVDNKGDVIFVAWTKHTRVPQHFDVKLDWFVANVVVQNGNP